MSAVPRVEPSSSTTTHQLYEQYGRQIYAYCLQRLRSREEAEDAVQTTFLNAFRALERGTVTEFQQAWLFKIAQNVCLERRQASGRRAQLESPSDMQVLSDTAPAHAAQDPEQLMGVEDALQRIPANQRKAILLREWQGLSYREIGDELGLSQPAVEMLIFRARRSLAAALEQPGQTETKKQRRATGGRALNFGSLITALKTMFTGGAAVKAVAVAVTAGAAAVAASAPTHTIRERLHTAAKPTPVVHASLAAAPMVATFVPRRHVVAAVKAATRTAAVEHRRAVAAVQHTAPRVLAMHARTTAPQEPSPSLPAPTPAAAVVPATSTTPAPVTTTTTTPPAASTTSDSSSSGATGEKTKKKHQQPPPPPNTGGGDPPPTPDPNPSPDPQPSGDGSSGSGDTSGQQTTEDGQGDGSSGSSDNGQGKDNGKHKGQGGGQGQGQGQGQGSGGGDSGQGDGGSSGGGSSDSGQGQSQGQGQGQGNGNGGDQGNGQGKGQGNGQGDGNGNGNGQGDGGGHGKGHDH